MRSHFLHVLFDERKAPLLAGLVQLRALFELNANRFLTKIIQVSVFVVLLFSFSRRNYKKKRHVT